MQVRYQLRHSPKTYSFFANNPVNPGKFGGAEGTRTPDPLHAMQVRYQLRHSPKLIAFGLDLSVLAGATRLS
jgi:hypothetical protein